MINIDRNPIISVCKLDLDTARAENDVPKIQKAIAINSIINHALENELIKSFLQVSNDQHQRYLSVIIKLILRIEGFQPSGQRASNGLFEEYSQHEISHSYTIMNYMNQLFGSENKVNSATYFFLIMVALCHDLGMTIITNNDIEKIKRNEYWSEQAKRYNWTKVLKSANEDEKEALSIIVRNSHHENAIIRDKVEFLLKDENEYEFLSAAEWDLIYMGCYAHGCSIEKIKEIIIAIEYNPMYREILNKWNEGEFDGVSFALVCALLRICDLLDISGSRIGDYNAARRTNHYNIINGFVDSVEIVNDLRYGNNIGCISGNSGSCECKRVEKCVKINFNEEELLKIDNPISSVDERNSYENAYIDLLKYFEQIENEIKRAKELLNFENVAATYTDRIKPHLNECLKYNTERYKYLKISVDENTVLSELMSNKLYGSSEMAIRELLQNAFDACQAKSIIDKDYTPKIRISYDNGVFSIRDNGIGMSTDIIENYFLKAGKSLYKSNEYKYSNSQFFHAGQFGMGVFSIFMLTQQIKVTTVSVENTTKEHIFTMKKRNRYVKIDSGDPVEFKNGHSGTKIELIIDDNVNLPDLESFIKRTFLKPENLNVGIFLNGMQIELPSMLEVEKKQEFKLNRGNSNDIIIDLSDYLNDVRGHVYLGKCACSKWWYNASDDKFETDCKFDGVEEVAEIEVIDQTLKYNINKIVRFIIPWNNYYARTKQDLSFAENLSNLETLMGHDFSKLCKQAGLVGERLRIKRSKERFEEGGEYNGGELVGCGCNATNNKAFYVNNILITEKGDNFKITLPMDLPYRVSCLVMNIINFDSDNDKEIELLLSRNDFTNDTYKKILTAVRYTVFKYLSKMSEGIDLSERIKELDCKGNFLIKSEE